MATLKQIEANRRNAKKSTGPKTIEGKAVVSLNALRHGLRARRVVMPDEDETDFHQLCDDLEAEWQPRTRTERCYIEQMAIAQWKLQRLEGAEVQILAEELSSFTDVPLLDRLWRAQCRLERSFARAQHELEYIQKSRPMVEQAIVPAAVFQAAPPDEPSTPPSPSNILPPAPQYRPDKPAPPNPVAESGVR